LYTGDEEDIMKHEDKMIEGDWVCVRLYQEVRKGGLIELPFAWLVVFIV
jgi:hypothetical protein